MAEEQEATPLGELLRSYRVSRALSQEELAARVTGGLSIKTIGNIERGRHRPQRQVLDALSAALALAAPERRALLDAWRRMAAPAPSARRRVPALPHPPTPLIGRAEVVAEVRRLLQTSAGRLVTLTGPAGVGKTRVAIQVAAEVAERFRDGVRFVALDGVDQAGLVPGALCEALGVRESAAQPAWEALRAMLAEMRLLLVLDNCEQVVEAAPLVADLLATCPGLVALVTSRVALRLRGEQEYAVPPLPLPPLAWRHDAEAVGSSAAVRLFVQRAQEVVPGFALTPETAPAVAEICVRLDGLPLALELAAPWLKVWSPKMLLRQLEQPLQVLVDGARDLPERQQTLRRALAWSHDLLDPAEQALFRRLAVFAGGWTAPAAAVVCGDGISGAQMWGDLARLLSKSMIVLRDQGGDGEPRFGMLETLREFALEHLEAGGEYQATRRRHAEYVVAFGEAVEQALGSAQQAEWIARLDRERDNLHAAMAWTREHDPRLALRLGATLWRCWYAKGYLRPGREWLTAVLAHPDNAARDRQRARALLGLGGLAGALHEYLAASAALEEGEAVGSEVEDWGLVGAALHARGSLAWAAGDLSTAADLYRRSLALARAADDRRAIAAALANLSALAADQGDLAAARSFLAESLAARRAAGDPGGIAAALHGLGDVALRQGDLGEAGARHEESLRIRREVADPVGIGASLAAAGDVARAGGDHAAARAYYEESRSILAGTGDTPGAARALAGLGWLALDAGDPASGLAHFERALEIARHLRDQARVRECEGGIALSRERLAARALRV